MNACDILLGATGIEALGEDAVREAAARIPTLPVGDLRQAWSTVQNTGFPHRTPAIRAFATYFDGLGANDPDRCVDFLEALVRDERSDEIVALAFDGKLVPQLAHFSLARIAERLVGVAKGSERWSRMLGAAYWSIESAVKDQGCGAALLEMADRSAFEAWDEQRRRGRPELDFDTMTLAEVARCWVTLNAASAVERERDDNASNLFDFQWDLTGSDPERAFALVLEVLSIERDPMLLGLLAAGLLEDCVPAREGPLLDTTVAEAERNPRFRRLLAGIYTSGIEAAAVARLDAVTDRTPGPL